MAGVTLSFVADPALVARVKDIARTDGLTQSQATARASALGVLLPASARRTLRFVLAEGGDEAQQQLAMLMTKAIAHVGNTVLERQLLARANGPGMELGTETEEDLAAQAVQAVADYRREQREQDPREDHQSEPSAPTRD